MRVSNTYSQVSHTTHLNVVNMKKKNLNIIHCPYKRGERERVSIGGGEGEEMREEERKKEREKKKGEGRA